MRVGCIKVLNLISMRYALKVAAQLFALTAAVQCMGQTQHTRRSEQPDSRNLLSQEFYRSKDPAALGALNLTAGMNNPLKGLIGGARWATPPLINTVPLSI
jgi:protein-S-isoprenylcysteine O-methyltransferase Ste14